MNNHSNKPRRCSIKKHSTPPSLMQKLVSDEEIQRMAEAVRDRDLARNFALRKLIYLFLLVTH
ncbi:hypothetical protein B9L19_17035 [Geobacillus thermocatenulatus]|uniref:Uncharacterized protein n=1 Tax=Geobacillus thermocatenulatus TaxID=33938 RepID=A0AA91QNR4_9BACL|nr:hypothetical protein B9L19_17035 [Geobacillus thermocatenulatus]